MAEKLQLLLIGRHSVYKLVETPFDKANLWRIPGIDLLATAINRIYHNDFFDWSRQILDCPGRTVSLNMLGVKVLMTDQPENAKTILSTKVSVGDSSPDFFDDLY